jgi:hypothetical protein
MICEKHKNYKAMRKPRVSCDACWGMFLEKNPEFPGFRMSFEIPLLIMRKMKEDGSWKQFDEALAAALAIPMERLEQ